MHSRTYLAIIQIAFIFSQRQNKNIIYKLQES